MAFDFKGKRVVVAGGSRGIGRSIALGFAEAGADVSICARNAAGLAATSAELGRFGGKVHAAPCDLASAEAIAAYVPAAAEALGGIDILVNNASGFGQGDTEAGWDAGLKVDVMAVVRASHAAEPFLAASKGSSIVNIASISGFRPSLRTAAYAAVKAAVIHYTTSQAAALARKGIRVNCVAPGSIEFPGGLWEQRKTADPALYQRTLAAIPFGRMGSPEEMAHVVMFLASPYASWVTGQTIAADGGQLLG
ncbi:SDR family NAD(P)-dependent oxidoreductase [Phreatobacter sp. AB_2022a]|uniref:SDR family NAD(P)-dependent oxidoreductase n=1 Tax=Phreatobacter sp. AB_2022a TaxID=3003134 RepID=UPI002286DC17|nr:SDR family oxidoreductase [Phreatobacter sp. AB_2022a]MCZ0735332.1 SDR family oxidoreductase [Phreatobacter sp. AB_2022a]